MKLYQAIILSGVLALGVSTAGANELSGLDAQQKKVVVIDGPKDGGAIVVRQEVGISEPDVIVDTYSDTVLVPETLPEAVLEDRRIDVEASESFDVIQQRLQVAVDTPVPAVEAAIEAETTTQTIEQTP